MSDEMFFNFLVLLISGVVLYKILYKGDDD